MQELLPHPRSSVDVVARYAADERTAPPERPWTVLNMIASIDGAVTVDGRSGGLGDDGDRAVFGAVRGVADVVLVGASTATAERYRPPSPAADQRARRLARGQAVAPRVAVVSGRLHLDLELDLFGDPAARPLVFTTAGADPNRRAAVEAVAEVVALGTGTVDLAAVLAWLRTAGTGVVLCEGGPTLAGAMAAADLLDEVCLSLAPHLVAGPGGRLARSDEAVLHRFALDRALEQDGSLFLRYLRRR